MKLYFINFIKQKLEIMNLKSFILSFFVVLVTFSCEVNNQKADNESDDLYAKNLTTAKKFFELLFIIANRMPELINFSFIM